jgi:DNA-binding NarL/FixJ family response regulator
MFRQDLFLVLTCDDSFESWARALLQRYGVVRRLSCYQEDTAGLSVRKPWTGVVLDLDRLRAQPVALIKRIREDHPQVAMLAIASVANAETVNALQVARAEFAMRPIDEVNLASFTRRALVGGRVPNPHLAAYVDELARTHSFTPREVQLVAHALGNESREEAINRLGVTHNTLKSQVRALLKKCGERSMDGLAKMILRDALFLEDEVELARGELNAMDSAGADSTRFREIGPRREGPAAPPN